MGGERGWSRKFRQRRPDWSPDQKRVLVHFELGRTHMVIKKFSIVDTFVTHKIALV